MVLRINNFDSTFAIEREALIDLYNSTNGDNWSINTNWLGDVSSECNWFGVICDDSKHIESLHLFSNNLNGSIPNSIKNLTHLKSLLLHNNNLSGSVPQELLQIDTLESVTLNNNTLDNNIISLINQRIQEEQKKWDVKNDNIIGIEEAIYALQVTSGLLNKNNSIVYQEDFSTDPKFSSLEPDYVFWDSENQYFYAKVFDVNSGNGNYYALSPVFETIISSFIIEFDFKVIKQDWGNYPGVYFVFRYGDEFQWNFPFTYVNSANSGSAFQIWHNDTEYLTSAPTENHWYHIKILYSDDSKEINYTVIDMETKLKFYEINLDNFLIGQGFNQMFIGQISGPPKYGTWSDIAVDNIEIKNSIVNP